MLFRFSIFEDAPETVRVVIHRLAAARERRAGQPRRPRPRKGFGRGTPGSLSATRARWSAGSTGSPVRDAVPDRTPSHARAW